MNYTHHLKKKIINPAATIIDQMIAAPVITDNIPHD